MPELEQQTQKRILDYLKGRGVWSVKVITANRRGCPDILVCAYGFFLALEVKRPGPRRVSQLQQFQVDKIIEAGGTAIVVSSVTEVVTALNRIEEIANEFEKRLPALSSRDARGH